ncbi:hypothetical protein Lalb_Chr13g0297091 [Lupinus albus]|uniref:Uncharacterized protein n=1 Tax=Lupinus albus TaxID=3870 RepID=A0A6A4PIJ0_LUPAL|nr:hypothetical protein Lalb_Chr13g0297091 [Lupinus albus]
MGGGSSKINAREGVVVPVKIRPLLLTRFEEFRKRRNGGTLKIEGTLSRKKLLKDGHDEEDDNSHTYENEKETQDKEQVKDETMVVRVISIEKISRVVPLPNSECESETEGEEEEEKKEEKDTITEHDNQDKVFHVDDVVEEHEEENTRENEQEVDAKCDNENSDDEDDDDDENEECGRVAYPRSPSFRIYCIETENKKHVEEGSTNETIASKNESIVVHKKSASADSIHSAASKTSRNSNEVTQIVEIESTRKRKGNKMMKFGAVRTLLKVKSCYHPMSSCTGNSRTHLLVQK